MSDFEYYEDEAQNCGSYPSLSEEENNLDTGPGKNYIDYVNAEAMFPS